MTAIARARYRARQYVRGLHPHLAPSEVALARNLLAPAEFVLFLRAEPRDRRHSMDLYRLLERSTPPPAPELLTAALLHDIGKGQLAGWHRVLYVIADALTPALARRLESPDGAQWRQALWRLRHHAHLSAAILREAGTNPRVIEIVESHTAVETADAEIAQFIRADDRV